MKHLWLSILASSSILSACTTQSAYQIDTNTFQEKKQAEQFYPTIYPKGEIQTHDGRLIFPIPLYNPMPKSQIKRGEILEGEVDVQVMIAADGSVKHAIPIRYTSHELAIVVTKLVKRWRYQPATLNGKPISISVVQPFVFDVIEE